MKTARHMPALACVTLFLGLGSATAQTAPASAPTGAASAADSAQVNDPIIVLGSRIGDNESAASEGWIDIDNAELARVTAAQTLDALRNRPGIQIASKGSVAGRNFIAIRGGDENFTQVLVEQVKANDISTTSGGSFDFANIDPNFVESIEILKRPSSAIYGADAISGVVATRLQTFDPGTPGKIWGGLVTDKEQQYGAYYGVPVGDFGLLAGVSHYEDEGNGGEFYDRNSLMLTLINREDAAIPVRIAAHFSETENALFPETSGGFELATLRDLETETSDQSLISLQATPYQSDMFDWNVSVGWLSRDADTTSPGIVIFGTPAVPPSLGSTEFDRIDADTYLAGQTSVEAGDGINLNYIIGANWSREDGVSAGEFDFGVPVPDLFELERDTLGVYAEAELDLSKRASATVGIRYDDFESESKTTTKADFVYRFGNDKTEASAHFSQGFKLPSFFALGSTLVGNPDLVPEESEHYSIALNHDVSERFTIGGTLFKNEFENLIEFDAALFTNVNLSTVDVQGLEIEATALPLDTLSVSVFGIWSEYEINGASAFLRLRPESQIGMDAVWDVSDTWLVSARAAYTGSREDNFLAAGNVALEEYVTFDVNSIWEFADDKRIKLGVLNLFDEDYQETFGNPAKEARLYFALEGDF